MFKKLLKYDMKATWRVWWILIPSLFGLSTLFALSLRIITETAEQENPHVFTILLSLLSMLFMSIAYIGFFGSIVMTEVLVFVRFYKNLFTDEGYLTFTLPVSRPTILLSKTVNALFWMMLHLLLLLSCVPIFLLIVPIPESGGMLLSFSAFADLFEGIAMLVKNLGGWLFLYVPVVLLLLGLSAFASVALIQFCITFGATVVRKAKLLLAVGIYYGINSALSIVFSIGGLFGGIFLTEGFVQILTNAPPAQIHLSVVLILLLIGAMLAAFATLLYSITLSMIERKLNLS